jgi:hypothetical protein
VIYRHQDNQFLVVALESIIRDVIPRFDILRDTPNRYDPRVRQAMTVPAAPGPDPSLPQSDPQKEGFLDYFAGFKRTVSGVDKWFVSLRDFCIQFRKHSLIELSRSVAQRSEVVARDIFNVAFHAVCRYHQPHNAAKPFYELFACVGNQLCDVLSFPGTPPHVAIALTTLIEFMDRAALSIILMTEWDSSLLHYRHPLVLRSLILKQETHPCPEELSRAYLNAGMLQESHQFASFECAKCAMLCDNFEEIARVGGPRFAQGYAAIIDSISQAQLLTELQELSGGSFQARLSDMSEFFNVIYPILLTRIERKAEAEEEKMMFLRLAAQANEWQTFSTYFDRFYKDFASAPPQAKLNYVKYLWADETIENGQQLAIEHLEQTPEFRQSRQFVYRWALYKSRSTSLDTKTLKEIKETIECVDHHGCHRVWAWVNLKLFENMSSVRTGRERYRRAAVFGFCRCATEDSRAHISFLLQMLSLVLDHSGDSNFYRSILERVPLEDFVNVLNHIIPRQGGRAGPLASELVAKLLDAFPYQAVFPCLYSVKSDKPLIDEAPADRR